jgi:hypothetical protein
MTIVFADPNDPILKSMVGASVFWKLAEAVNYDSLIVTLDEIPGSENGYDCIPAECSSASALLRALNKHYSDKSTLVKANVKHPMPGNKAPVYGVFVRQETGKLNDSFELSWTVGLVNSERGSASIEELKVNGLVFEGLCEADRVREQFADELPLLGGTEQSSWLTHLVKSKLRGIPFGNGQFFVAPQYVAHWRLLREALLPLGIILHEIPAMRSDQAVAAVMASLEAYSAKLYEELDEELNAYDQAQSGDAKKRKIQQRVVDSRVKRAEEQLKIISVYEELFETKMDDLRAKFDGAKAAYVRLSTTSEFRKQQE